jgi:hypothetical protein
MNSFVTFKHGQHHGDHVFLQVHQFLEEIHLARVLGQFVLHVREQEKETTDSIPQSAVK